MNQTELHAAWTIVTTAAKNQVPTSVLTGLEHHLIAMLLVVIALQKEMTALIKVTNVVMERFVKVE